MSLPPITIPELDPAAPIDPLNDLVLLRQGLNDRKATVQQIGSIRLETYPSLPNPIISTDRILVGRNNGIGYDNYLATPQSLGFLINTTSWFYQNTAPLGWEIVPNTGDKILACMLPSGASYQYNSFGEDGSWQQQDHSLTIEQIPAHSHYIPYSNASGSGQEAGSFRAGLNRVQENFTLSYTTGGTDSTQRSTNSPPSYNLPPTVGHNHGNQWRPLANVGIICRKTS